MNMLLTKKVYDPVHGFIRFNELEQMLIDTPIFQRLHHIHQLGNAFLVYPGATHTRFEHSLGTMELTTRIFDQVHAKTPIPDAEYWRQILRFAALCHDLGHLPFSHVAEKILLGEHGHESWTWKIIRSKELLPIWQEFAALHSKRNVQGDIAKMALGQKKMQELDPSVQFSPWEKVLAQMISADFFGSDRIDYLLRDAQCTGVSYGLFDFHQLIETLIILPTLQLGMEEDGIEACEALLLARYFMYKRIYQYSTVKAYSFHLARFMKKTCTFADLDDYLSLNDHTVLANLMRAAKDSSSVGHADAVSILEREKRYIAYKLPDEADEHLIQRKAKEQGIPMDAISLELQEKKKRVKRLAFPVVKRNGQIVDASLCSEVEIPLGSFSWAYISPKYKFEL